MYKFFDFIVNAVGSIFALFTANIPVAVAFLATAISWFDESGKFTGDTLSSMVYITGRGLTYFNGTLKPFVLDLISSLGAFNSVWYPKINAVFPLDFLITAVTIYFISRVIGIIIRVIKSFIPTISG